MFFAKLDRHTFELCKITDLVSDDTTFVQNLHICLNYTPIFKKVNDYAKLLTQI